MKQRHFIVLLLFFWKLSAAQDIDLSPYDVVWESASRNASESMPCGGGDIGLNVWVENGDLLFYVARSGTFDENNTLLKLGRVRLRLFPNPLEGEIFQQVLKLEEGYVSISGKNKYGEVKVKVWVDVFSPVIHVEAVADSPVHAMATYENWRYRDRITKGKENNANTYKWAPPGEVRTRKDKVEFNRNAVLFYHRNSDSTVFDVTVQQQGLEHVKADLTNPLGELTFGGWMEGRGMEPAGIIDGKYMDTDFKGWQLKSTKASRKHEVRLYLHTDQASPIQLWKQDLLTLAETQRPAYEKAWERTRNWWRSFWSRSFIIVKPQNRDESDVEWQMGRNYQLFRYMLACNAYGTYPTKFNGGLFTYDPSYVDSSLRYTPDFRNWGGGTHTAQNQRLVYWPLLRSGDFDLMKPAFDFYNRLLNNAELRSKVYWGHGGASFTEQLENFGLPNPAEYGWKRPEDYDQGMEYNAWLEYQWDTVLEFCMMVLETYHYQGESIKEYLPLIESCLLFFDEHYQYLARRRGVRALDNEGHLIIYPGSAAETYKMAYNANSTIAALKTVLEGVLKLPSSDLNSQKREYFRAMLKKVPPLNTRTVTGYAMLAPAKLWERVNNTEVPQLYPVFPWGVYGLGRPGLDTAVNTYKYDPDAVKFRSHIGWKQDNIFAARLGLTAEAVRLNRLKLKNSGRRFPAFWGPGFDWTPDHNWGGAGMIGLQEMLLQTDGEKIYVLPAWPMNREVEFKLHAPQHTTVYGRVKEGRLVQLEVLPASRAKDVVIVKQ
ncbi:hypothetical protein H8S90_12320 [Olivibacter sp. SDN3]|uniref:DUF5703 domain-containing protein n=1 Tax=Olivibacter sp. SDN3 TaxID=2764720 RepID=UPI001650D8FB|nr:DUF5703 domain-containing protein [Olivibacter sp. SDN3]QNL52279.1 hypothetical protein H8S90_12320 [Olivibacter sp. SDN3]